MSLPTLPRLPGVYFLPPAQPATLMLPRLDVAAFVGFAQRGPLHTPVAVEDVDTFRAVFGGDVALARDAEPPTAAASAVWAHLPEAAAAFFRNGGRRCYVVRVAGGQAASARLRAPGLVGLDSVGNGRLGWLHAGSPGAWSKDVRLASRLRATPLPVSAFGVQGERSLLWLTGSAPQAIQIGDLLRLVFADGQEWLFPVTAQTASSDPETATTVTLHSSRCFPLIADLAAPATVAAAARLTLDGSEEIADAAGAPLTGGDGLTLRLTGAAAAAIVAGDVLRLTLAGGERYLFGVTGAQALGEVGSPPQPQVELAAASLLRLPGEDLPAAPLPALVQIDRLRFDQLLWLGRVRLPAVEDVAFGAGHPRFWGEMALAGSSLLPGVQADGADVDAAELARLYRQLQAERRSQGGDATNPSGDLPAQALAALLAPVDEQLVGLTWLPLGMASVVGEADAIGPAADELGRDGLDSFSSSLFVDPVLVPNPAIQPRSGSGLEADAFNRYYVQDRRLRGLHSLLYLPEVALIAVPDAVHRPWGTELVPPDPPPAEPPPIPPDWTRFQGCPVEVSEPAGPPPPLPPDADLLPRLEPVASFDSQALLDVQHALVNFCQARRDVVAVLSLPLHFEKRQCIEWQETLRQRLGLPRQRSAFEGVTDFVDLSYLAAYHPWLMIADEGGAGAAQVLRVTPPDGAVCGMIAARERARQVWVAPANTPLQGVLDLLPAFDAADWADLYADQLNLIRREPDDFRAMSAHTLSEERQLLQLSVRRLMILLRKVALERGMAWTFENNDQRLRDAVRTTLETLLRFMFERGAFAGRTPQQAFRIVTDGRVNTRQSIDQGRFIAQVQVAPSEPMEFITVLLSRASDGVLLAREG
ncbi:MAG TPA: hypothetical protein PKM78_14600 [Anaerolineae bacterium]|nr:hypothetical protein [Anaerolineae bacterium]HNU03279.1 hypothetical protein [Anaerolineae bacterium]